MVSSVRVARFLGPIILREGEHGLFVFESECIAGIENGLGLGTDSRVEKEDIGHECGYTPRGWRLLLDSTPITQAWCTLDGPVHVVKDLGSRCLIDPCASTVEDATRSSSCAKHIIDKVRSAKIRPESRVHGICCCCKLSEASALRLAPRGYRSQHFHGHDFLCSVTKVVTVAHELNHLLLS